MKNTNEKIQILIDDYEKEMREIDRLIPILCKTNSFSVAASCHTRKEAFRGFIHELEKLKV